MKNSLNIDLCNLVSGKEFPILHLYRGPGDEITSRLLSLCVMGPIYLFVYVRIRFPSQNLHNNLATQYITWFTTSFTFQITSLLTSAMIIYRKRYLSFCTQQTPLFPFLHEELLCATLSHTHSECMLDAFCILLINVITAWWGEKQLEFLHNVINNEWYVKSLNW